MMVVIVRSVSRGNDNFSGSVKILVILVLFDKWDIVGFG